MAAAFLNTTLNPGEPVAPPVPVKQIIANVAKAHGVAYEDIIGHRRTRKLIPARFAAYHAVANERRDLCITQIGKHFGNRDHSTILRGLQKAASSLGEIA